jgi:hypothetical protein
MGNVAAAAIEPPTAAFKDPLSAENLADARLTLGLPGTANLEAITKAAREQGYDGIQWTGTAGTPGGLTQGSFITGLAPQQNSNDFFPYDTQIEYDEALYRYTLQGVFERQTINGLSFDTNQAITGLQTG